MWPSSWESLKRYYEKASCGCRYAIIDNKVVVSPERMQRCFKHKNTDDADVEKEVLLLALEDIRKE